MAAGATIGSNHNSRGADGEIIAGRGFWPGLCVSLKHNSRFASFTIIAKGDFPAELDISIPFSLVSNDVSNDRLVIMPGYWFLYNMYALARNAGKYGDRDRRIDKSLHIEYDYLAPDSVNEMIDSLEKMQVAVARSWCRETGNVVAPKDYARKGAELLQEHADEIALLDITLDGVENSGRPAVLVKVAEAWHAFREMICYHAINQLLLTIKGRRVSGWKQIKKLLPAQVNRKTFCNIGGLLVPGEAIQTLIRSIKSGKTDGWDSVHSFYRAQSNRYASEKYKHAWASLYEMLGLKPERMTRAQLEKLVVDAVATAEKINKGIYEARAKDYRSPFRQMVYETKAEMEKVIGKLSDNSFIRSQEVATREFRNQAEDLLNLLQF